MAKQQHILRFTGSVQGVGFRYTACRAAGEYEVTGFVRNCRDGSVECVVEGERSEIKAFADDLNSQMAYHVKNMSCQIAPFTGAFQTFGLRY